jgi:tetratricopeptide (TPR) repeat protein
MLRATGLILLALVLVSGGIGNAAEGDSPGQEDLDKATQAKLAANSLTDLNDVVRLLEDALKKGLDADNTTFANQLLSATLFQRGALIGSAIFESMPPDPRWPDYRRVALQDLERAVKLDAQQAEALYLIARLNQLPGGDEKRAKESLDQAIQAAADTPVLRSKILVLRATAEKDEAKKLADLAEAIQLSPGDATPLRTRGAFFAEKDQHEKALEDFNAALKLDADHSGTWEAKASCLAELKRYDEALACTARLRELEPKSVLPLVQEARILALQENYQGALHSLEQAEAMEANNVGVFLLRGMVYQEMKEPQKALAAVEEALKLRPGLEPAMRLRAILLAGTGKFDLAIEQLGQLLKEDPEDIESRLQLAMFHQAAERPRQAIAMYSEVLKKNPDNHFALRGRADALLGIGKHAEAVSDYEKALQQDAKDTSVLNNLAWVLATSPVDTVRNGKRAIELATKACELTDYKQGHILSTLGAAYAETGDFETAKKWSQKAIELGAEDQKEALKKELESYQAGKPVREMQTAPEEPAAPPAEAPKAESPQPAAPQPVPKGEGPQLLPIDAESIKL